MLSWWLERDCLGEGSFQKCIGLLGKDSVVNFKRREEGKETVNWAGAEWGLLKSKTLQGSSFVSGMARGAVWSMCSRRQGVITAIHTVQCIAADSGSKHCSKQPLQGFEQTWVTVWLILQCYVQYYWQGEGQEEKQENKFRDYGSHLGERLMDSNQVSPTCHVLSSCCCVRYNRKLCETLVELKGSSVEVFWN